MVHQLKLQNVTQYISYAGQGNTGYKFYAITAQNQDTGAKSTVHLMNTDYVRNAIDHDSDVIEASRTFDCRVYNINKDIDKSKEVFHTNGLKLDGVVQYDAENHTFTATVAQDQSFGIAFSNSEYYTNSLNSLMNSPSYLSSLVGE